MTYSFGRTPTLSRRVSIYYYSETEPTSTGKYWHYDSTTGLPVAW